MRPRRFTADNEHDHEGIVRELDAPVRPRHFAADNHPSWALYNAVVCASMETAADNGCGGGDYLS